MGKAQDPGPGSRVDNPLDVEVTGDLPVSLTTFVGGYSGLGRETARTLAAAGADLIVPARDPDRAAAALGGTGAGRPGMGSHGWPAS